MINVTNQTCIKGKKIKGVYFNFGVLFGNVFLPQRNTRSCFDFGEAVKTLS